MDNSALVNLQNQAFEAVDDILELENDYVYARAAYQRQKRHVLKFDKKGEQVPPEENKKLATLERECREKHEIVCRENKKAEMLGRHILNAMKDNPDKYKQEIENFMEYVENYSNCPDDNDWLILDEFSGDDSSIIDIASDFSTEEEEEKAVVDKNMPRVQIILDKLKMMKNLQNDLESLAELKNEKKAEMFAFRDRGENVAMHQNEQREMYQQLVEGRAKLKEMRNKIRDDIHNLIPNIKVFEIAQNLRDIVFALDEEEIEEKDISISAESTGVPDITRISPPKNISRIPKVGFKTPQRRPSGIPQRGTLKPPSGTPLRPKSAPSPLHRPQLKLPQSNLRPSGIPTRRPIRIDPKVQEEIDKHKSKQSDAANIRKFGTYGNLQQARHFQQIPKLIPRQVVEKRKKQHGALLKISESIGNVKKVGIRPVHEGFDKTGADFRVDEVKKIRIQSLNDVRRKNLSKLNAIAANDSLQRRAANLGGLKHLPLKERAKRERTDINRRLDDFKWQIATEMRAMEDKNFSWDQILLKMESKLESMFRAMRDIMAFYRGPSFIPNEPANRAFIDFFIDLFGKITTTIGIDEVLNKIFERVPYPKFSIIPSKDIDIILKMERTAQKSQIPSQAPRTIERTSALPVRTPRRPAVTPAMKLKVKEHLKELQISDLPAYEIEVTTRGKLEAFTNTFCKLFICNQKNRRNTFNIWVKVFYDNMNPILNDLEQFYSSLPYPEIKRFNRQQVKQSLEYLLNYIYNETKKRDIDIGKCKSLVGNEMNKLVERKHLKNLHTALGVFIEGVKELMEPYLRDIEMEERKETLQREKSKTEPRSRVEQLSMMEKSSKPPDHPVFEFSQTIGESDDEHELIDYSAHPILLQVPKSEVKEVFQKLVDNTYTRPTMGNSRQLLAAELEKALTPMAKKVRASRERQNQSIIVEEKGESDSDEEAPASPEKISISPTSYIKINHPVALVYGMQIPKNIIERDILYVACQLASKYTSGEDAEMIDKISMHVIRIAAAFQNGKYSEYDALRAIKETIRQVPCIPLEFYNTFIYHSDNEYFDAIYFADPKWNAQIRNRFLSEWHDQVFCPEDDRLIKNIEMRKAGRIIEHFISSYNNKLEDWVLALGEIEMLKIDALINARMVGSETANNGNEMLAIPGQLDTSSAMEGEIQDERLRLSTAPQANVAKEVLESVGANLDQTLNKQVKEDDHFENSRVAKNAIKYRLQPKALQRKNFFKSRGSDIPKWFPGFAMVYPNSYDTKPINYSSLNDMLVHAWRTMAPSVR